MFKHSLFYRLLSSSLLLGWLVSAPEEERVDYISPSYTYQVSSRLLGILLNILYKVGGTLRRLGDGSIAGRNLLGFLGILVFCYFIFDLACHDYGLRRTIIETILALGGLSMLFRREISGWGQGSLILSFFHWWARSD